MGNAAVRATCVANWDAFKTDCSGFAKAVATALGVALAGNADAIADALVSAGDWTPLADGVAAAAAAGTGQLVIGGLRGDAQATPSAHGHVVVVVSGALAQGKYPRAFWGQIGGVSKQDETVNWAWTAADRDRVVYAARDIPAS